jgi:CubicO group peptidase (beta-lactamase class C family)
MNLQSPSFRVIPACLIAALGLTARPELAPQTGTSGALMRVTPDAVGMNAATLKQATDLLNQYVAGRKIAGAVAGVARKGKLAYLEAAGVQSLETRAPMTAQSLFRIYSMTKPITAVAAMILHEEGKFALADPVSKYLPEFKQAMVAQAGGAARPPAREITIEDLLLHTSGLNHRTSEIYRREQVRSRSVALPQFVQNIVRVPLMEDPHTRYRYSESPTVVGRLIEVLAGKPFDIFLAERVLGPLQMRDTMFWVQPADRARLTQVYGPAQGGGLTPIEIEELPFTEKPALIEGAVGLVSTVPDFMRFSQMLLNKGELDGRRILKAETVEMMTKNGLPDAILKRRGGTMGWGLANVNVQMSETSSVRGEYGWDGSAGTIFWIDPARETVIVLMTQSQPANPDSIRQRFKALVDQAVD